MVTKILITENAIQKTEFFNLSFLELLHIREQNYTRCRLIRKISGDNILKDGII